MADGKNRLHKIAFQIGDRFFRFAINPDSYSHSKPHRTTAVKTKSRIVVEDFQSDIPTISIKGTTGFNPTGRAADRGIAKIKEMKKFLENYAEMGGNGRMATEDFYFHNFTNDESFVVHLSSEGVTYTQDVQSPLTYRYEISFLVLRKAGEPPEDHVVSPEIGNRFPSLPVQGPSGPGNPYPMNPNSPSGTAPGTGNDIESEVYNDGKNSPYVPPYGSTPINPQAPSAISYEYGRTGLGYIIGYYGRGY